MPRPPCWIPVRQRLLAELAEPDSASGLARRLRLPRQRINYHLRALETAGLVELVEERRKGNCIERVVRATARAFVISPEALGPLGLTRRDRAATASAPPISSPRRGGPSATSAPSRRAPAAKRSGSRPSPSETDVRFATAESRAAFAEELAAAVARLAAKYHDERAPDGRRFRLLAAVAPRAQIDRPHRPPASSGSSRGKTTMNKTTIDAPAARLRDVARHRRVARRGLARAHRWPRSWSAGSPWTRGSRLGRADRWSGPGARTGTGTRESMRGSRGGSCGWCRRTPGPYDAQGRPVADRARRSPPGSRSSSRSRRTRARPASGWCIRASASGAAWDDEVEGITEGWQAELASLRHYLERHRGRDR